MEGIAEYPFESYGVESGWYAPQEHGRAGEKYFRFVFCVGGPHEELRFLKDGNIEFHRLRWNAHDYIPVTGDVEADWIRIMCELRKEW